MFGPCFTWYLGRSLHAGFSYALMGVGCRGAAAVSTALFLALVLRVDASVFTRGAAFTDALLLKQSHCFEFIGGLTLRCTGSDATTLGSDC